MNDKKKNNKIKPEDSKKASPAMDSDEITDFDEMRDIDDTKKEKDVLDSDSQKDTVKESAAKEDEKTLEASEKNDEKNKKEVPAEESDEKDKKDEDKTSEKESSEKDKKNEKVSEKESDKKNKKDEDNASEKESGEKDKKDENKDFKKKDEIKNPASEEENSSKNADNPQDEESEASKNAIDMEPLVIDSTEAIKKQETKKKKALWITLGSVAGVLLIAYFIGFIYFSGHFYKDAAINGINVSDMNKEAAKQTLDGFYQNYVLTLETIDGKELSIDGKDISMEIVLHDEFSSCFKQQKAYLWFINMFKHYDFNIGADTTWNQSLLDDVFDSMKILKEKNMTAPEDAYVGVEDGKFVIIEEILGNTINVTKFKNTVEEGLSGVASVINLKDSGCYTLPKIYSADETLKKDLEAKNTFAQNEIKLQLDDLLLEPGMELYDAVLEKKNDSYQVSKKLVEKYVKSLAKKYDTAETDRTFTTSFDDKQVQVHGTAFGYEMNQEETTDALYKALKAGKSATVEAVFNDKGYTLKGENDIGDTYIEVNLSEQKVFAYKDGKKIAEGDCVSGKESDGHGTCIGLYAIQDKLSPTVLRGEKKPVTKTTTKKKKGKKVKVTTTTYEYEYESPVTFWMQFNGGIGLHDAAGWRSVYGGSIYYYSGSHGCVNLPYDLAETLYKNFDIGTPVVVYFWDNENRK